MLTLVAWFLLAGCPGEDSPPPPATTPPPVAAPVNSVDGVRAALVAGKYAEALTVAEKGLGEHAADDVWWDLVEVAALRGGQAGALLDRLGAADAIGGRKDRHFALRGSLAAEARRPVDLLAAARALQDTSPGDAAVFSLAAVRLGATLPPDAPPATVALVAAANDRAAPIDPLVEGLTGDRAVLARVELLLDRGDRAAAAALLATAAPKALLLTQQAAALKARVLPDAAVALTEAQAGAKAAADAGDLVGAARVYAAALPVAAGAYRADAVVEGAAALRATAQEKKNVIATAEAAALQAEAALRAGSPSVAREAATLASQTAATKARGQWALAMSSAMLGDAAGVDAAATGLPGVRVAAVRDLARAMRGEAVPLPSPGVDGADGALQALLGAGWLADPAPALAGAAAAATGAPDLAAWAAHWSTRGPLPVGDAPSPGLAAENAVRTYVSTGAGAPLADLAHPQAAAWNVVITNTGDAPPGAGLGGWVRLRTSLANRDTTQAGADLAQLAATTPEWRRGPLAPVLALDTVGPEAVARELAGVTKMEQPFPVLAVLHGWHHRNDHRDALYQHGVGPVSGAVKPELRDAVWTAAARLRVKELAWVAGAGDYPKDERKALEDAEAKAELKSRKPLTLKEIANAAEQNAVWSLLPTADGVEVLTIAGNKATFSVLPAGFGTELGTFLAELASGSNGVGPGDRLRTRAVDGPSNELLGIGTYHVVGPAPLGAFPIDALPEQGDGIRYLMAIRNVLHHGRFEDLAPGEEPLEGSFTTSMLSVAEDPANLEEIVGIFPDGTSLTGKAATVAAWKTAAATARFIHFGKLPATPDGGFVLPSGEKLHLGDIAGTATIARTAVIGSTADPRVNAARIGALRAAGVRDVFVTGWIRDEAFHTRYLTNFWDRANRRYNAVRSLTESRNETIKEFPAAVSPAWWGGYQLSARK